MTIYQHPGHTPGRIVFGGEVFVDGLSADITPGPETERLFEATGITKVAVRRTEKETLQAEAVALGLSDEGTIAELTERINAHMAADPLGTNPEE